MIPPQDNLHFEEPILDVGKSTKKIIFGKYRSLATSWIVISVIWFTATIIFFSSIKYSGDGVLFVAMLPAIGFFVWWGTMRQKVQSAFMAQFAKQNGFQFSKSGNMAAVRGLVFDFGHSKKMINEITGVMDEYPIKLYNYQSTTGSGKNSQDHDFTLFEMTAKNDIPQLFLNSKKAPFMNGGGSPISLSRKNILKLEGDFNKYFDLYVPIQYEQEALEIFTPEIMAELIDTSQAYDLEIVGRQVRIITNEFIDDIQTLNAMHNHARRLIKLFEKTLSRFSFQLIGDFSPELKPAAPLLSRYSVQTILTAIVLAAFLIVGTVILFLG